MSRSSSAGGVSARCDRAPIRRIRSTGAAEFANIPLLTAIAFLAGMPATAANIAGLLSTMVLLVQGGTYWLLKAAQLRRGDRLPAGLGVYRVLRVADPALLAAAGAVLAAGFADDRWWAAALPGAGFWILGAAEYVNYFHLQLSHPNRAARRRLSRTRRLHPSHLARDLARDRARVRTQHS